MGCTNSKIKFVMKPDVPGQNEAAVEIFEMIGIKEKELNMLFRIFHEIDVHSVGSIQPIELYTYVNVELGSFEKNIFDVLDADRSGKMNFAEFVSAMWNFLTVPENQLGAFAYLMRDPTGVMRIHYADAKEVFEMIHRKKMDSSPATQAIITHLRENFPSELSIADLCKWTTYNSSLISPILVLQIKLRKNIIGEKYWQQMMAARAADPEKSKVEFIKKMTLLTKSKAEQAKQMKLQKEKLGKIAEEKGLLSGVQANISEKQGMLLDAMGMSKTAGRSSRVLASPSGSIDVPEINSSPVVYKVVKKIESRDKDGDESIMNKKPIREASTRKLSKQSSRKFADRPDSASMKKTKSSKHVVAAAQ